MPSVQLALPFNHTHHWLIEVDRGQPYLKGQCECGATYDEFKGIEATFEKTDRIDREKSKLGQRRMREVKNELAT